ncbi:N-acetyltransferase [Kribbella turkmenica]|uniref:N-acetyltransferase n=1 Tax=Kribbella turkmenica TaxID=2530375 RepID=A0A4R4WCL6_9ACTN|nr:N-acetyltransferase [Kribbella turkmenica]
MLGGVSSANNLIVGDQDPELEQRLSDELDTFNTAATGADDRGAFSVKVTDDAGGLVGGLAAWTWGGLCGIDMVWIREDSRNDGWGSKILLAAEEEARRRGCDRIAVSSFTFQAPGFYQRHGYVETGRTRGIPGGNEDVHMFKSLT